MMTLRSWGAIGIVPLVTLVTLVTLASLHDMSDSKARGLMIMVQESNQEGGGGGGATGPKRVPVSEQSKDRPSRDAPGQKGIPIGKPVSEAEFEEMKRRAAQQDADAASVQDEDGKDAGEDPGAGSNP